MRMHSIRVGLLCAYLAAAASLAAQSTASDSFPSPMNLVEHMFGALDVAHIPYGVLYPAALPLERTHEYNGRRLPHDGRRLTPKRFGNLLFTLQSAQRDTSRPALFDTEYMHHYAERAPSTSVHISAVFAAGANIRSEAIAQDWIRVSADSSFLYDSPTGGPQSYTTDTVFAFSPLVERSAGASVTYHLDSDFFYGNLTWPTNLEFDPGDGAGFRSVSFGDSLNVSYVGIDTARLELRFAVGSQNLRAYASLVISPSMRPGGEGFPRCFTDVPGVSIELQPADEGCEESWFANTVIVVDGIDPGTMQNIRFDDAYEKYSVGWSSSSREVSQELLARGYDFAFINFEDGGQSVEATAQILKAAIRWINAEKARRGNAGDNIVIGHSMGGLTSKWALSELARDNETHGVSKFFSFDSPLRGAVIPLGLQSMLQYLINFEVRTDRGTVRLGDAPAFARANEALNGAAARELLIYSVTASPWVRIVERDCVNPFPCFTDETHTGNIFGVTTAEHDAFQVRFDALHPLNVPHYALSDGSRGLDQLTGTTDLGQRIQENGTIVIFDLTNRSCSDTNDVYPACGPDSYARLSINLSARYFPQALRAISSLSFFFDGAIIPIRAAHAQTPEDVLTHGMVGLGRFDLAPGSQDDSGMQDLLAVSGTPSGNNSEQNLTVTLSNDHFAHVPTSSALNLPIAFDSPVSGCGPGITECITPDDDGFLASRFLAATQNHEHVTFTPSLATGLLDRIPDATTSEWAAGSNPATVDRVYNFSADHFSNESAPFILAGVRTVTAGGAFDVNRLGRIRWTDDPQNPTGTSAHFALRLGDGYCDPEPADITLQSGAAFRVGHDQTRTATVTALPGTRVTVESGAVFAVNNDSRATFLTEGPDGAGGLVVRGGGVIDARFGGQIVADGGVIRIESGGHLRTTSYGAIVARNGGRIILEDGANVELWDGTTANSDGRLSIQDGGKLVIEGEYTFTGSGYFHLARGAEVHGPGALRIRRGDVATATPNKELRRLVLTGGAQIALDPGQDLSVEQCLVEAGGGGIAVSGGGTVKIADVAWEIGSPAVASDALGDVEIRDADFVGGYGPYIEVASATVVRSVLVDDVSFYDMDNGITFAGDPALASARTRPKISNAHFYGGRRGLQVAQLRGVGADDCTFAGLSESAVNVIDGTIGLRDCTIDGQHTTQHGLVVENESLVEWRGGGISDCETGAYGVGGADVWFFECASVVDNGIGLDGHDVTYRLGGIVLVGNDAPVRGVDVFLTRSPHGNPAGSLVQNTLGRVGRADFLLIDYSSPPPTIDLRFTEWIQDGAPAIPDRYWFCSQYQNNYCSRDNVVFAPVVEGHGCGNDSPVDPPCSDPPCKAPCPEDGPCFGSGGGGVVALAVRPNPAGTGTQLRVSLPGAPGRLAVVDVLGREHYGLRVAAGTPEVTLPPGALTPGAYFVTFAPDDGRAPETVTATIVRS